MSGVFDVNWSWSMTKLLVTIIGISWSTGYLMSVGMAAIVVVVAFAISITIER